MAADKRGKRRSETTEKRRAIQVGDTVIRVDYPLESGTVIEARQFTVVVRWPGGGEEEIGREALVRQGFRPSRLDERERDYYAAQAARRIHSEGGDDLGGIPSPTQARMLSGGLESLGTDPPWGIEAELIGRGFIPPDKPER
jgi:hypothetical protein